MKHGNRYFDPHESRPDFPRRAYARIDDIEPIIQEEASSLTFIIDAVDANWKGFSEGGPLDLIGPEAADRLGGVWRRRFGGEETDASRVFGEVPLYRIEVELQRLHKWFDAFPKTEEPWFTIELTEQMTEVPVLVYGGLFAEPVIAYLHAAPKRSAPSAALSAIFDMTNWPDATNAELMHALDDQPFPCPVESLVCFDIGQGLASALVCECGVPIYYFDVGCGSGRNAPTAPARVDFCTCDSPTVILSHWDTDHWAGAKKALSLQGLTWIVPRQTISTQHAIFGNDILAAGGRILVVANGHPPLTWTKANRQFDLRRSTGKGRNASGLALVITHRKLGMSWVLTGDAGYDHLAHPAPAMTTALVAPHHGADMGKMSIPYKRSSHAHARLIYSFGPGNSHGSKVPFVQHPIAAAATAHIGQGWSHGAWTSPPGQALAGGDVLATATHKVTHQDGVAVTWSGRTPPLSHLLSCVQAMPVTQW